MGEIYDAMLCCIAAGCSPAMKLKRQKKNERNGKIFSLKGPVNEKLLDVF